MQAAVRELFQGLGKHPVFQRVVRAAGQPGRISLSGLMPAAKALYSTLLWQLSGRPVLYITDGAKQAELIAELTSTFHDLLVTGRQGHRPMLLPAHDVLPHQSLSPHSEISEQRAIGLWRLASRRTSITVTPIASLLLRTHPGAFYPQLAVTLHVGEDVPQDDLVHHLESIGYERREPVEMVGDYSVRGGIVDIFPAEAEKPVRIEMFGDLIESIRRFDVETQRSVLRLEQVLVLPLREQPKTGEAGPGWEFRAASARPGESSLLSLTPDAIAVWDEPEQISGAAGRLWKRMEEAGSSSPIDPAAIYHRWDDLAPFRSGLTELELRELDVGLRPDGLHIPTRPSMAFHGNMQVAVAEARNALDQGGTVVLFATSTGELERFADILREYNIPFQLSLEPSSGAPEYLAERAWMAGISASTFLVKGAVRRGVVLTEERLTIFGSEDLFDTSELVARPLAARSAAAAFAADLVDLKPGDFVVHTTHGVGRFIGLREVTQADQKGDFMLIEYAGEARLYLPLSRLDLVQRFRGSGGESPPALDKLGGVTWSRTKSRVKARMRDMAEELLKLYAERRMAQGFGFSADSNWQREFEDAFEFSPTRDQLSAAVEIKRDMERTQPMDRLLCGDVGFGKTEVAMRAAFKALGDGKQVAILAPTTVLCFQHHETFRRRFAAFPVRVEMLSRFCTAKEIRQLLPDVAAGKVDVVVGTHRLLSKDVEFNDLGLLVIDEEQRFGVRHKERLKQLRKSVDVLTMTATPIPRTLHMSLLGLRDMSVIETPPKDRLAIQTVVAHFNPELVRAAIEQEVSRGGQVYFIHNRVDTIWSRAASIQQLLPQARIGVGHGQMGEAELEKVVLGFMRHEYDVFVSTTIVENGLDIPLANTIIIENAERYGLSELYQLRGRVGRSNRRAYAYLLVPEDTELSDVARKRLAALREFSDLGAGFKIAALDLELRGAGNLLGGEQHGHIAAVGFETYVKLLEETVRELKGEEAPLEVHSTVNLGLDVRIPPDYIAEEHQRLRAYKKIAEVGGDDGAARVLEELQDRYGAAPPALKTLLEFAIVRSLAERLGVELIDRQQGMVNLRFHKNSRIDPARLMELVGSLPGAQFTPAGVLRLPADGSQGAAYVLHHLKSSLLRLGGHGL
jgi:transcription-repair coupling factor (superfamily II helicase)